MKRWKQGKLYELSKRLYFDNVSYDKGSLVVYIEEDSRISSCHWVLLPNGRKWSIWSGHMVKT